MTPVGKTPSRVRRTLSRRSALCLVLATLAVLVVPPRSAAAAPGDITTVAGNGDFGVSSGGVGDGGPATAASLVFPYGVTATAGKLYLSQNGYNSDLSRVRLIQGGVINTVAGGADPPLNDGALAIQAPSPARST